MKTERRRRRGRVMATWGLCHRGHADNESLRARDGEAATLRAGQPETKTDP
jgi:hypothetical protein